MLIFVTNRKLCQDNFLHRIDQLAKGGPYAIMLREKDLDLAEYEELAVKVKEICDVYGVPFIINQNIRVAAKLKLTAIHLSMPDLRRYSHEVQSFTHVGASVHSVSEAAEAEQLGASYIIAGHIFPTNSKKGVPPRGLSFLKKVCDAVTIPVFAIGGITKEKAPAIIKTGAKGMCIMSEAMTCSNPAELVNDYKVKSVK
ncbi:MAG TPA: thiamine phosphate synthase [Chondromyces sp.]|nr:thiamine phosphate synthase [Chondromyces sp.]